MSLLSGSLTAKRASLYELLREPVKPVVSSVVMSEATLSPNDGLHHFWRRRGHIDHSPRRRARRLLIPSHQETSVISNSSSDRNQRYCSARTPQFPFVCRMVSRAR
jgi:hypothetical protein